MTKKVKQTKENKAVKVVRVSVPTSSTIDTLLKTSNGHMKNLGRKVMPNDLIELALGKITDDDLKALKRKSLKPTDIDTILYRIYVSKKLGKSKEDFSAFTRTPQYLQFVKENEHEYVV